MLGTGTEIQRLALGFASSHIEGVESFDRRACTSFLHSWQISIRISYLVRKSFSSFAMHNAMAAYRMRTLNGEDAV